MRSRSEVRAKSKPSAVERTPDLPNVEKNVAVKCALCHATPTVEQLRTRADGTKECPECGNVITDFTPTKATLETKPTPTSPPKEKAAPKESENLPKGVRWCLACGSEWHIVNGSLMKNCGNDAGATDDPSKIERSKNPPAGLQGRVPDAPKALDRSNAKEAPGIRRAVGEASGEVLETPVTNRLSIAWGKARMPIDRFNSFECGGFIVTIDLPEGADRVTASKELLSDLEQIAEEAFRRQRKWYLEKLGILGVSVDE